MTTQTQSEIGPVSIELKEIRSRIHDLTITKVEFESIDLDTDKY